MLKTLNHLAPGDRVWLILLQGAALLSASLVGFILLFLVKESWPFFLDPGIATLFQDPDWSPTLEDYNLIPMVVGSFAVTLGALAIAVPFGLGAAIFACYYAPSFIALIYRRMLELLAGIPSVVYGFWGLVVLVPLIARVHPPGPSLLAGIVILALMILPTLALIADSQLRQIPPQYWRSSQSMGIGRWATLWTVCLPAARPGLMTAIGLGLGRALGETMAVLMVCGNVVQIPDSLYSSVRTLTANIALEMAYASGHHRAALFVTGLLLLGLVGLTFSLRVISFSWTRGGWSGVEGDPSRLGRQE
ncbi:phosphate ABC transporter permease subunit PstC [Lyngbya confervoides]|uniref:Phosphate transport system permease protein n=1 Tax=Lyngbya confervoides BDU141951 TaxID=1574623 RepID=A0ABD4T428_9CYAN|nr:phosphate ABC transporter permease subunit PstC [Lyngbya confervoides]MCM1983339.1 phosphate ABC transporter permease subunit PstC [Lyngbya confervoides BDU141951]